LGGDFDDMLAGYDDAMEGAIEFIEVSNDYDRRYLAGYREGIKAAAADMIDYTLNN
jgi:hypothetical protein